MPVFDLVPNRSTRLGFFIFLSRVILYIIRRLKKFVIIKFTWRFIYVLSPIILVFMLNIPSDMYEEYMKCCTPIYDLINTNGTKKLFY